MTDTGFQARQIADNVYWVGAIDWSIRNFHGYATYRGTTYNAYLILAEKITLIDTVKKPFFDEMIARIASVIDPSKIDYVISNHAEMDHSGSLTMLVDRVKPAKVFASKMGVKALNDHFHPDYTIEPISPDQPLSLGNMTAAFVETKMLHWPDSMVTYLVDRQILFSQDAFGMHLASSELFDDELDKTVMETEAKKYYANILTPLSPLIAKVLPTIESFPHPIKMVAPDHGPIWRTDIGWILGLYRTWSAQKPTNKAVIVYDTMWNSTDLMARSIASGLRASGTAVTVMPLASVHRSDVATELLDAAALLVGSPTINNNMFPTVADVLCYLTGLKFNDKLGLAFGSYGWSGEATKHIAQQLTSMKVQLPFDNLKVKYVPNTDALAQCHSTGQSIAEKLKGALA